MHAFISAEISFTTVWSRNMVLYMTHLQQVGGAAVKDPGTCSPLPATSSMHSSMRRIIMSPPPPPLPPPKSPIKSEQKSPVPKT